LSHKVVAELVANVGVISVEVGASVTAEDAVMILESMKMEIPVLAEKAGVVRAIKVATGDVVHEGDVLLEIDPA
jgi:acetyl-CoA carboxylase biotin carboxyl carrier protein